MRRVDAPLELLATPARAERFWSNVSRGDADGCWNWLRAKNSSGYGVNRCGAGGVSYTTMAHRVAWILTSGEPVPNGKVIDHLCRNRACCNPAHLRAVNVSANVRASSWYKAGSAAVVHVGPKTIRPRGDRFMVIWREYLADGRVRQAGQTVNTYEEAMATL